AQAVSTWRRVQWGERMGLGGGTVAYFLGRELEALGQEDEARESYRKAASSEATTESDEGPVVGPAARDHLADLGVATAR
ncbi:MAG: tetratricopeptide repeat protein, partial [Vicinamibacteria bacterium]